MLTTHVYRTQNVGKIGIRAHARACIYCRFKITPTSEEDVVEAISFECLVPNGYALTFVKMRNVNNRAKNHPARASSVKANLAPSPVSPGGENLHGAIAHARIFTHSLSELVVLELKYAHVSCGTLAA